MSCQQELVKTKRELAQSLPPHLKFTRSVPSPDLEARIAPHLHQLSRTADGGSVEHHVECRGTVCRLELFAGDASLINEVEERLQSQHDWKDVGRFHGAMFESPSPGTDPVTGKPLWQTTVHMEWPESDTADGSRLLERVLETWKQSNVLAECYARHPIHGELVVRLSVESDPPAINVQAGGSLANTDAGNCLLQELDVTLSRAAVPERVASAVVFTQVVLPPGQ